jgi:hypothetical protein
MEARPYLVNTGKLAQLALDWLKEQKEVGI